MKWSSLVASKATVALLAADAVFADPLTTILPCPSATGLNVAPITVTSQYQPVSTCQPSSACVQGKCSTAYSFTTFPYVSTVVPYAWNGTTTQKVTVTDVSQPIRVSEYHETLTQVTAAPSLDKRGWFGFGNRKEYEVESVTVYETVTRRAVAPFRECGPLPIPGWEGSGLCEQCESSGSQLLDIVECRYGTDAWGEQYQTCAEWYETLFARVAPTTTVQALCSSSGNIPSAGVYTWTFPQAAAPVTVTAPPTTVTITIEEQPVVTVYPEEVQVIPGQSWNAYVTKTFGGATIFDFNIYITQPIIYAPFPVTQPATSTSPITIPTGSQPNEGSWPLPEQDDGGDSYYGATQPWLDWTPAPTASSTSGNVGPIGQSTTGSGPGISTSSNNIGPIGASTSTSLTSSNNIGPISASTSSSSAATTSTTLTSSNNIGPINGSTSTSSASSGTASNTGSSSSNSASSSSSSSTSGTSSSSSSSSTSTSTTVTPPSTTGDGFYLRVAATPVARRKRQDVTTQYLGFNSDNLGVAVDGTASAALVFGGPGDALVSDGMYIGTSREDTSLVKRTAVLPPGFHEWYFVGRTAQLQGTAGFCLGLNGSVTAYVAPDTCDNQVVYLAQQNATTSSTTASATTSTASSGGSQNATTSSVASNTAATSTGTASSTSSGSSSAGPIGASTSAGGASSTATAGGSGTSSGAGSATSSGAGNATSSGAGSATTSGTGSGTSSGAGSATSSGAGSGTSSGAGSGTSSGAGSSTLSTATSATTSGSGLTISVSVGPIGASTSSSSSSTAGSGSATTSGSGSGSATTSTSTSASSSSTPICNINANICPDSSLLTANVVATQDCTAGLTCTVDQLATLVPDLLTQDSSVATVLLGNNQALGLDISPSDVTAAVASGTLNNTCSLLEQITVQIDDPTCFSSTTTTTSSTSATSATSASGSATSSTASDTASTSSSSSSVVTTTAATTTTTGGATTSSSTTSSATASSSPLCGVQLTLCAGQTLQNLGLNTVTCGTSGLLNGTLCDTTQVLEAASDACLLDCEAYGSVLTTTDGTGANLDPVIGTQSIQSIQALVDTPECVPSSQTVTLSEPGCPVTVLKRSNRYSRSRYH